jgi:AhpD family alkylhydroperoxidase
MSKYILMVFAAACSYGILSSLVKLSYAAGFNAAQVSFVQALLGAGVLWLIILLQKKKPSPISARNLMLLLLTGSAIGLTTFLYYLSVKYIPASIAIIILMQFTWITVLLDWYLLKNAPGARLLISIACILIGTVLATGGMEATKALSLKGICIAFASALLYALYIVANSRVAKEIPSIKRSAISVSGAAISILLVNGHQLAGGLPVSIDLFKWTGMLALFGTIIPPVLFAKGIPKIGASVSSVLMVAEMPVAILCAALLLKEPINGIQWAGIGLMLCAIIYLNLKSRQKIPVREKSASFREKSSSAKGLLFCNFTSSITTKTIQKLNTMKTFTVPARENVTEANQAIFDTLKKKLGKVPNLFATMAYSKNALSSYLALSGAPSSLTAKEKEVVNLAVSQANGCEYCLAAHTAIGKLNGFTDEQILEIRSGAVSFDARYNALAALAKSFVENFGKASEDAVNNFFEVGFTNENLVDTIILIGDKTITNYLYAVTNIPVDFPAAPALPETVA